MRDFYSGIKPYVHAFIVVCGTARILQSIIQSDEWGLILWSVTVSIFLVELINGFKKKELDESTG